jgi:Tol biopolymer transport system component
LTIAPSGQAALNVSGIDRTLVISPDGTRVVYVGRKGTQLFVRPMDQLDAAPLGEPGTPRHPFMSPDGTWIGVFEGGTIKNVAMSGGPL